MSEEFTNALVSAGPSTEVNEEERMYDWLIGSWRARTVDYLDDGTTLERDGEWHFAPVLEGRAIQDVWISPSRANRSADTPKLRNRYGTTLRMFDPEKRRWVITWINPIVGAHDVLLARREGGDIVQEGHDESGNVMRWGFTDIMENSARWYGTRSYDDGKTWKLEAEFFLTRNWT